ncbi:hypothetical protein [Haloterrigena salifodinae]|uniref:hypothetical protein n=1 Tax=Haloterrigena salifodinae TaxID=2675099 RepID=UPI000F87583B|nr:hypothetical protein [Haloterrigena salifodinae]
MRATIHTPMGMALAVPILAAAPEFAPCRLRAGFAGGLVSGLYLYIGYRKALHYPVYASIATVLAISAALLVPSTATAVLAAGLAVTALHDMTDAAGAGLGLKLRPWRAGSERAVYSHTAAGSVPTAESATTAPRDRR